MPLSRTYPVGLAVLVAGGVFAASSCSGTPVGPDALRPETFQLFLVNGQALPLLAYLLDPAFGGTVWITSARLKSTEAGRTIDPRIFEDRSGSGGSGGSSRDSTTAAAKMADIREFEERTASGSVVGHHTDTSAVTVERRGDLLIITRDAPVASRTVVDTAYFQDGNLVVLVREWERFGTKANNVQFVYSISK